MTRTLIVIDNSKLYLTTLRWLTFKQGCKKLLALFSVVFDLFGLFLFLWRSCSEAMLALFGGTLGGFSDIDLFLSGNFGGGVLK